MSTTIHFSEFNHCGAWFTAGMLMLGCTREIPHPPGSGQRATDFPTNVIAYEVKGVLKEIRANGWKALIEHEDIPGYKPTNCAAFPQAIPSASACW